MNHLAHYLLLPERRTLIALLQRVADGAGLMPSRHPGYDAVTGTLADPITD